MECTEKGSSYKQVNMVVLWDKVKHVKRETESGFIYRYKQNITNINGSKERFDISKDDSSNIWNQTDEISSTSDKKLISSTPQTNKKRLRSSASLFNKEPCIICLSNEATLHKLAFKSTGEKRFDVAKRFVNSSLLLRLNTISNVLDTIVNDVQYHATCWVNKKGRLNPIQLIFRKLLI